MTKYLVFLSIGFELVGLMLASYFIGPAIDKTFSLHNVGFLVLSIISLIGWLVRVIWLLQRIEKSENQEK